MRDHPSVRRILVSLSLVSLLTACSLNNNGQLGYGSKSLALPAGGTRDLAYPPTDADGKPVEVFRVLRAIAEAYPLASQYGPVKETGRDYARHVVTINGTTNEGLLAIRYAGVRATVRSAGSVVNVGYVNGVRSLATQRESNSATSADLVVTPVAGSPGRFQVECRLLREEIGSASFVPIRKLAELPAVADDVVKALATMNPAIPLSRHEEDEFDAKYSPPAVFANYTRALHSLSPTNSHIEKERTLHGDGDLREGKFSLDSGQPDRKVLVVKIEVRPYRDGSKVRAVFDMPYSLKPDGSTTYSAADTKSLLAQLRKIAAE